MISKARAPNYTERSILFQTAVVLSPIISFQNLIVGDERVEKVTFTSKQDVDDKKDCAVTVTLVSLEMNSVK